MTSSTIDTLPSDRVELRDGDINHELVSESIRLREGRLLVSGESQTISQVVEVLTTGVVSASGSTRDIVRQSIAKAARINNAETIPDIELLELDYQPEEVAGFQTTQPRRNGPEGTMGA